MENGLFDTISSTALLVAYARQFSHIPYSKALLDLLDMNRLTAQFDVHQTAVNSFAALLEARYKVVDQALRQWRYTQVLELASGLLPRGMIWSQQPEVTFVESDLPLMIEYKQQLIRQLIGERANLRFEAINVAHHSNPLLLAAKHFQPLQPIAIICEGLLQYLSLAEKVQVFANVRHFLQQYPGQWITPDLATKAAQQQIEQYTTSSLNLHQLILQATGRSLIENSFGSVQEIQHFAAEQGFCVEMHSLLAISDELTCLEALDMTTRDVEPLLAERFVCILSLSHNQG